uniref:Ulp1 protease family C-terminal catalytic domain containing protein expressed n=1 Tax=Zea mays TaxID=4577 RepID=A0A804NBX2_MAIZE
MALEAKQAALCFKEVLRLSIRKSYRFVSEHPILFGLGVFLYLFYRSSPRLFVFLLSSSPVNICTALLLGILLSYGEVNLPEASKDHRDTTEVSTSMVGNSSSDVHFEANQRPSVLEFRENASNFKERETKQKVSFRERASEHVDLDDYIPLLKRAGEEDERGDRGNISRTLTPFPSMVNIRQESVIGEDLTFTKKRQSEGSFFMQDRADCQTSLFDEACLCGLNDKDIPFGLFSSSENVNKNDEMEEKFNQQRVFADSTATKERDSSEAMPTEELAGTSKQAASVPIDQWENNGRLNVDTSNVFEDNLLDSSLGSPWARVSSHDGSSGFDSDQAESSPDASMTDIAPVLDEIDPLLRADSNHPDPVPNDDSDTDSHVSEDHQIDDDSNDEGDDIDAKDNVEGEKENDGKEAAFLWTADDEKNLMDLGYSEIERNRRLEILMARRRSWKNMAFEIDNNLIDVHSSGSGTSLDDLSRFRAQVPPIAVPRRNPFDLPYDSEEAAIPGSAPSILHARKNPFDLPLEQSNDSVVVHAHDILNSGEPATSRRDMIFRRHESFNFGRMDVIQEKRFSRLKPYFVPETVEWNASNFERQFNDKSESKMSSVTKSDIASSVADQEDHKDQDEKDLADVGSECSDGINSIDVELDHSDIDDREIALQQFVFERAQEREAHLVSTKGKGREEDYAPESAGSSTMPFHAVPDLLSWEDGDGHPWRENLILGIFQSTLILKLHQAQTQPYLVQTMQLRKVEMLIACHIQTMKCL